MLHRPMNKREAKELCKEVNKEFKAEVAKYKGDYVVLVTRRK